ncbi:two-component sensor histidine kinase [marine bacterium AO1-C]|nr:two-component sensor histidine kinase [marine bacterium AO1-C]
MIKQLKKINNGLFWRLSAILLALVLLIGTTYVVITAYTSQRYYAETTQRLHANVAKALLREVKPFDDQGNVKEKALRRIISSTMAVNPTLEVYLLDNEGKILSFVVPDRKVKLKYIATEPIQQFIQQKGELVLGDDPRNPKKSTVFSAVPVMHQGKKKGYVYIVLASEQFENISDTVWNSYLLTLGTRFFMWSLLAAFVLGLIIIWLLTRNLRVIIQTVRQFEQGNLEARIPIKSSGELASLSHTFNHMADTILKNIQEIKQVDKLRRELIANISHDLRTPLSVIYGYVETILMKQGSLSQEQQEKYLKIILDSSEHLKKLVADLFELTKLEARQVPLHKQPFMIAHLLEGVSSKYDLAIREKQLQFTAKCSNKETLVFADMQMIERVIQNLVDNAINHSPIGSEIVVEVNEKDAQIEVSISNEGNGIPQEDLPHIFDRYYKAEKHYGKNKGTGLGLAIVKNILELHQSIIQVKSEINRYTTFYFQLPAHH